MNHYPHHIGDFNNATRHLTRVERSLYRDLIDLYYDTERPLNGDFEKLARRVLCEEDNKAALRDVLTEFFDLTDDGYRNARCDAEIAKYQGQIEQASRAGKASAAKRRDASPTPEKQSKDKVATTIERPLNYRTTNQNQNQNQNQEDKKRVALPDGVAVEVWDDFKKLRVAKRSPISHTALAGIVREAEKAGYTLEAALRTCCKRGWVGFEASWVLDKADVARQTVPSAAGPDPELERLKRQAAQATPIPAEIRDRMARLRVAA